MSFWADLIAWARRLSTAPVNRSIVAEPRVRCAIVVGHNARSKGAYSPTLGSEFDFNNKNAQLIANAAVGTNVDIQIFNRRYTGSYSTELKDVYDRVDAWDADCSIELHFNGHNNSRATGSLVLRSKSTASGELSELLQEAQLDAFGLNDRGVVLRKRYGMRGWLSLYEGKAPAALIEPGFGSNPNDAHALKVGWEDFAEDLILAVRQWARDR